MLMVHHFTQYTMPFQFGSHMEQREAKNHMFAYNFFFQNCGSALTVHQLFSVHFNIGRHGTVCTQIYTGFLLKLMFQTVNQFNNVWMLSGPLKVQLGRDHRSHVLSGHQKTFRQFVYQSYSCLESKRSLRKYARCIYGCQTLQFNGFSTMSFNYTHTKLLLNRNFYYKILL